MTPQELEERVRLGEDARTEFKVESAHPDALAVVMVSFANSEGGVLLLGVADDRALKGVADPDAQCLRIDEIRRNNVEPPLSNVTVEKHLLQGVCILAVHIPRGVQRPHRTNKGVYYVRSIAGHRIATRQELLELYQSANSLLPDEMPAEDARLADLDLPYLIQTRPELRGLEGPNRSADLARALANIKVMADAEHPTLGGLLCYGREPERLRPYARVTAIRHSGVTITEAHLDRQEIGGQLERQIRGAQDFVRRHLPGTPAGAAHSIYPPPLEAIDQALVNAVAHRDYFAQAQVRLFLFDDRVEVISPGRLLNHVTVEQMRDGCHVVRNPLIFQHLSRVQLATDAGRGVPTMFEVMRGRSLPEPEIRPTGLDLRVTFRLHGARP
ncbi:MAG: putative DNA binding domain-containing protein [Planctomycetes bacterium]|nr:putative DNA binding domain-containing protein [Planctomycetota bacterium]